MLIGILSLQGCCVPHRQKFAALGVETRRVVDPDDLDGIDGLVIPGGESTTMLKMTGPELWQKLRRFAMEHPVWGVCAGCIMIADRVENPDQDCLELIGIVVRRNAYGSQNDSLIDTVSIDIDDGFTWTAVFIRAPKIVATGEDVRLLACYQGIPVMVENGRHLATTFHPELVEGTRIHHYFLNKVKVAGCHRQPNRVV